MPDLPFEVGHLIINYSLTDLVTILFFHQGSCNTRRYFELDRVRA
jgi:hypothetical protein